MPTAKRHLATVALPVAETPAQGPTTKYQAIFDQASDAILAILADGRIDAANLAVEEMTGYLKTELAGAHAELLVPDEAKLHAHAGTRARAIRREFLIQPGTYEDIAIQRKDGYVRFVDLSVRVISDGEGGASMSIALFRDVTEKKRMERELITKHTELRDAYVQLERKNAELQAMQETLVQSGKMAALGELAAGIAHELNQPLQGIRGYAQELRDIQEHVAKTLAQPPAAAVAAQSAEAVHEIISSVDKMAQIIEYMRAFIRKSNEKHELTDVHVAIDEALKMLSRQFAMRGIRVERDFAKNLPQVYANPLQLEQVFINLSSNARDAIEATGRGNGKVSISTKAVRDAKGEFVEIVFRDDGTGMSERTKSKMFNPFFTTKEVGKGMGLGLSLSYGILSKLQASVVVESELGKGAAFVIRIPRDFRELA
jgi:PAS domain S-box-containing protein